LDIQNISFETKGRKKSEPKNEIPWRHKQLETLADLDRLLRLILETMPAGLVIQQTPERIAIVNNRFAEILGFHAGQLAGKPLNEIVCPEDQNHVSQNAHIAIAGKPAPTHFTFRDVTKDSRLKNLMAQAFHAPWHDSASLIWYVYDISQTKLFLMQVERYREMSCTLFDIVPIMQIVGDDGVVKTFPIKFKMSTDEIHDCIFSAQMVQFNDVPCTLEIFIDVSQDKSSEVALIDKESTLSEQKRKIQNLNAALKVLIDHQESEKNDQHHKLEISLKKTIFPYLDKLKTGKIDIASRTYLSVIELYLKDLISSLPNATANQMRNLTLTESQVADIRQGKISKEIADMLNVSTSAIPFHRHNLQKNMGLLKKKTTLQSHLQSLKQ
jgi:PAS domain S-box-containing protein